MYIFPVLALYLLVGYQLFNLFKINLAYFPSIPLHFITKILTFYPEVQKQSQFIFILRIW